MPNWHTWAATSFLGGVPEHSLASKPALHRWLETVGNRPAVARGMAVPAV